MFWYWEGYHPPHNKERILPGGMMEITINMTNTPFCIYDHESGDASCVVYGPMLAGARTEPFVIDTAEPMNLLSVLFKPGGAPPFFGVSGRDLHNLHLPLEDVWGVDACDLYCDLREAPTTLARFRLLERALAKRLIDPHQRHRAVNYALEMFQSALPSVTVKQVQRDIALSSTRFLQVFREEVGMTPKQFSRVQRFQRALDHIAHEEVVDWAEVALACGYYDQSHFINEFRSFAGITPSAYAPQSAEHRLNVPVLD